MLLEHEGRAPRVDPGACVAPTAVLCGDVRAAAGARVLWNAVPIGWIAVGDPAEVPAPERHEEIWAIQRQLDFPGTVLGVARGAPAAQASGRYADLFGRHRDDPVVG